MLKLETPWKSFGLARRELEFSEVKSQLVSKREALALGLRIRGLTCSSLYFTFTRRPGVQVWSWSRSVNGAGLGIK